MFIIVDIFLDIAIKLSADVLSGEFCCLQNFGSAGDSCQHSFAILNVSRH